MRKTLSTVGRIILAIILMALVLSVLGYAAGRPEKNIAWGINYSTLRAQDLEMDPVNLFKTIMVELNPKLIRLPVYWKEIEPVQGQFNFQTYETLLDEADGRGTKVIIVVGQKQPRWPECHQPEWWNDLPVDQQDQAVLGSIKATVNALKEHKSITAWQVENEPFFQYGPDCPTIKRSLYAEELAAVRALDTRPLVGTDSGEKGPWITTAWSGVDILGATMYREVFLDKKGYYQTYPLPAWTYNVKAGLVRMFSGANQTIGVELQAEPWFAGGGAQTTSVDEQLKHMNAEIFERNIGYATRTGFAENYLWGAEWWYWMREHRGDSSLVDAAKKLFNE